jgi:hypothetical protein
LVRFITRVVFSLFIISLFHVVSGQESAYPDEQYNRESIFGAYNATNGGFISGLFFRSSKKINDNTLSHYGITLANTRHPRETKEVTFSGNSFVFGKSNYLISIRPQYGREKIFFKKAPQKGVRVAGLFSIGPTIGLEVPYYLDFQGGRSEQYNPDDLTHNRASIFGTSGVFKGLFESQVVFGINMKASLTYETNSSKNRVLGFEAGFILEIFTREIIILPRAENQSSFAGAFLAIYFGKRR